MHPHHPWPSPAAPGCFPWAIAWDYTTKLGSPRTRGQEGEGDQLDRWPPAAPSLGRRQAGSRGGGLVRAGETPSPVLSGARKPPGELAPAWLLRGLPTRRPRCQPRISESPPPCIPTRPQTQEPVCEALTVTTPPVPHSLATLAFLESSLRPPSWGAGKLTGQGQVFPGWTAWWGPGEGWKGWTEGQRIWTGRGRSGPPATTRLLAGPHPRPPTHLRWPPPKPWGQPAGGAGRSEDSEESGPGGGGGEFPPTPAWACSPPPPPPGWGAPLGEFLSAARAPASLGWGSQEEKGEERRGQAGTTGAAAFLPRHQLPLPVQD